MHADKRRFRWIRFLALMASCCSGSLWAAELTRPAPRVVFRTLSGQPISVEQFRGKVVLLKFFLTDCQHCQRTTTHIVPIYHEWKSRGLEVLGVAINPDARDLIPEFARRFDVTYPLAVGDVGMIPAFGDTSAVQRVSVPYIFMIDRKGNIRYEHPGSDSSFYDPAKEEANLRAELDKLLKEPRPRKATAR